LAEREASVRPADRGETEDVETALAEPEPETPSEAGAEEGLAPT
jgi:hypothetical protein